MNLQTPFLVPEDVDYPSSDGQPMADNTLQYYWIRLIEGGLELLFRDRPDVFVAGDLLWYPVQGNNGIRMAPDALVAFGRPKGHRGSYMQWREDNVAPQVVWEVLSPGNRAGELRAKLEFYQLYGVQEYYQYDPDRGILRGWQRQDEELVEIESIQGWISPLTGVRMGLEGVNLALYHPNGQRFTSFLDECQAREAAQARAERERQERAEAEARAAYERQEREAAQAREAQERQAREAAQERAVQERQERAEAEARAARERLEREAAQAREARERQAREAAEEQAVRERQEREAAQAQAERLTARLRALGIDPEADDS
jgi:Uma2 family endonuclease